MVISTIIWVKFKKQLPEKSVGCLLSNCRPTVGWQVANSQLTNGNCQPTKDQQSANSFPNFSVGEEQNNNDGRQIFGGAVLSFTII